MHRRSFLELVTAGALGARYAASQTAGPAGRTLNRIGVQLYTVRDLMAKDVDGTLAKVAAIGYQEVEFAGYFDKSPQQLRATLDRLRLTAPSAHIDYPTISTPDKLAKAIDDAKVVGHQFLVNPWVDESLRKTADDWKKIADNLNRAGERTKAAGIQFAYHNHHIEFVPAGGEVPFEILLTRCDKNLVAIEMDLCWTAVAGKDPLTYFDRYPGRFPLVHAKDMKRLPEHPQPETAAIAFDKLFPDMTEVGSGVIDWKRIFAASSRAGIQHVFVEHDQPKDPLASIETSYKFLRSL
jgi:sugar phosphate isomerase/epimerase